MDKNTLKVLFEESKKYAEKLLTALRKNPNSIVIIDDKIYHNPMIRISFKGVFLEDVDSLEVLPLFYNTIDDFDHAIIYKGLRHTHGALPDIDLIHYFFKVRLKAYSAITVF